MAAPVVSNPSIANRHDSKWWSSPIGVGVVNSNPVLVSDLPTSDPAIVGALWRNGQVVTVSTAT